MAYWVGLFLEMYKKVLEAGVNTMLQIAAKLMSKSKPGD
jgi:hypothetical protein